MNMPITLLTASVLGASTTAFAGDPLVWDNGDADTAPLIGWVSSVINIDFGYENAMADDFILTTDSAITRVQWTGGVAGALLGPTHAFRIEFYATDPLTIAPTYAKGDPSKTALATYEISPEQITVLPDVNWPDYELHFVADLPLPFAAAAGDRYWISIQAYVESGGEWFGWMSSTTQQLSSFASTVTGPWDIHDEPVDMAFKLYGTPVPGPGALALLGVAALVRRRRR